MYDNFNSDLSITLVLPKPLEEFSIDEQKELCKQKMISYIDQSDFNFDAPKNKDMVKTEKQKDAYCRKIYQNSSKTSDYDYLYRNVDKNVKGKDGIMKTLTLKQPAKVRNLPIVSARLRALISREKLRPLKPRSFAIDKDNIEDKKQARKNEIVGVYEKRVIDRINAIRTQQQALEQKKQLLAQYQNVQGADDIIMQLNNIIMAMQQQIDRAIAIESEEKEKIEKYYKFSYQSMQEMLSMKIVSSYIDTENLRRVFNKGFEEQMVTNKPVYYVDFPSGLDKPIYELVYPEYLDYQYSEDTDDIEDLGWINRLRYMTFQQIVAAYGRFLTKDQIDQIKAEMPRSHQRSSSNLNTLPDGTYVGFDDKLHHAAHNELYPVYECWWKEYVGIPALIKKNNNESNFLDSKPNFIRFLTTDEAKKMTNTDAKVQSMKRKGEKIEVRYRADLWKGIRIGMETYINMGKDEDALRDPDDMSDVKLPFVGKNIHRFTQARSPVWETADIGELINILHYQEELLVALSGVRGIVYDLAQRPDGMSPAEINYYMKQGIMYIKTVKKNNKPVNSSFNQFQSFDQSLSPSISTIDGMKNSLMNLISMITGVYPSVEGAIAPTDQVGTSKLAVQQSAASVETYFQDHEALIERGLTRLANLFEARKDKEYYGSYSLNKVERDIFNIPAGKLKGKFRILVNAGLKEQEAIDSARQIGMGKYQRGEMRGSDFLALYDMDNIHEMRLFFMESEEKMMKLAEQSQAQQEQAKAQAQQGFIQMKGEMDMRMKQFDAQVQERFKQMDMLVKQKELELQQMELQFKMKESQEKNALEHYKVDTERSVELEYLNFQKQELQVNNAMQQAQMIMQDISNKLELLNKSRSKEKVKD